MQREGVNLPEAPGPVGASWLKIYRKPETTFAPRTLVLLFSDRTYRRAYQASPSHVDTLGSRVVEPLLATAGR